MAQLDQLLFMHKSSLYENLVIVFQEAVGDMDKVDPANRHRNFCFQMIKSLLEDSKLAFLVGKFLFQQSELFF